MNSRTRKSWWLSVGLFGFLMFPFEAWAQKVAPFGPDQPVTLNDYIPHLEDDEGYTEEWNHNVWLSDGSFIAVDFGISNISPTSDHDGRFSADFTDSKGKDTRCESEFDSDEWEASSKEYFLHFGEGEARGNLESINIKVRCEKLKMDLKFTNEVPPWKPGSGQLKFGEGDGYYRASFLCPRATVTGTVTLNGESRNIEGVGHVMHTSYNMRPDRQAHRWLRFKAIDKDYAVIMAEMEATKEYGSARNGWVMVLAPSKRIIETTRVNFEYDGFIQDVKSDEGYRIPRRVRLAAQDGGTQLSGVMLMQSLQKVVDFTESMGAIKRAVVRRYTKPKDYHINCTYKFQITGDAGEHTLQGNNKYRFFYVNP